MCMGRYLLPEILLISDPLGIQPNFTQQFQFCGGYLDPISFTPQPYITAAGIPSNEAPKGFLCPVQSRCIENSNPYNGTLSFDNIAQSAEVVFVIISSNTFTDLMYYAIDAEYMVASLFFIVAIVVLTFWLVNLVIAVITSSFQITREESQKSAFSSDAQQRLLDASNQSSIDRRPVSRAQQLYNNTKLVWIAIITMDLTIQALRTSTMGPAKARLISTTCMHLSNIGLTESITTVLLAVEIVIRFGVSFPDWRRFFRSQSNCFDLFLVVATCIIQIPVIHNSSVYGWLTIFQIMRVYRVIMAVPVTRDLLVWGRLSLLNCRGKY
jgi:voltage-dependent calcium channel